MKTNEMKKIEKEMKDIFRDLNKKMANHKSEFEMIMDNKNDERRIEDLENEYMSMRMEEQEWDDDKYVSMVNDGWLERKREVLNQLTKLRMRRNKI